MCGIIGIVDRQSRDPDELRQVIRSMGAWQHHRGPDDWGEWFTDHVGLGHNRLSIIDIEGGKQPMSSPDGQIQVVFNGEIYNFVSLRGELAAKGHRFQTDHSDTEVIVHGYAEWGVGVFERLEGMFAIGIWDERTRRLVLARDRMGIKPLFLAESPGGLVFASEVKTVLASGVVSPELRSDSLLDYFTFRAPRHPHTFLEGMEKLEPGCWRVFDLDRGLLPPVSYWRPQDGTAGGAVRSVAEAEAAVEETLESAVVSHAVADVPVGVFLSGGVDSSLVASMLRKHCAVDAFTVGTDSALDESPFATAVAKHLGIRIHVRRVTPEDFLSRFDDWMYYNDDPVSDPSALALMLLSEHAREHGMKVMLAGEGADELFGGYNSYQRFAAFDYLRRVPFSSQLGARFGARARGRSGDYARSLENLRFMGTAHVSDHAVRRELLDASMRGSVDSWEREAFARVSEGGDPLRRAMIMDQVERLPDDVLARTDRATMALSLEARVPFLDRRVVQLANSLPTRWCVRMLPPSGKWLLKRIAARHVPREVVYRSKRGFDLPLQAWLANQFRERIEERLDARAVTGLSYRFFRSAYDGHLQGDHSRTALIWAWLVLEEWYQLWIAGKASPKQQHQLV